jgi:hypothetical protein
MLSFANAELVRRDPAIPGLAVLLDPDAFVAALRRSRPGFELGRAQITYVKYQPGIYCRVGYQLGVAGTVTHVSAQAFGSEAVSQLQMVREQTIVPGPLGPGRMAWEDCGVVVSVFRNDTMCPTGPNRPQRSWSGLRRY